MKSINKLPVLFYLVLLFTSTKVFSQNNLEKEIIIKDSVTTNVSVKGNLQVLTQKIFTDFTTYISGSSKLYKDMDKPMVLVYTKNGELKPISNDEMKRPLDAVESIEVVYDPRTLPTLYGLNSLTCVIKIKFKE